MRVVDLTTFFSDTCGGIKNYYRHKARFLPARGVDCHFIVPGESAREESFENGRLHRLPGPRVPGAPAYRRFGHRQDVADLLRRLQPDVIEIGSHVFLPGWVDAALEGAGKRSAVVGFLHSDYARVFVQPAVRWMPAAARGCALRGFWHFAGRPHRRYRATLVASQDARADLRRLGVPRVRWVGLGVDTATFAPRAASAGGRSLRVGYAGRLASDKRFGLLLEAFDRIHAATGAGLHVAGDGPLRSALTRFARTRPFVVDRGLLTSTSAVADFLGSMDLVVTPGETETFSFTTAEAMSCGVPVVAADAGGAGELVRRAGAGRLFAANDSAALARAAGEMLALSAAERTALGARGRVHVEDGLTWPHVIGRLYTTYQQALS